MLLPVCWTCKQSNVVSKKECKFKVFSLANKNWLSCICPAQVPLLQRQRKWCMVWCSLSIPLKSSMFRLVLSSVNNLAAISWPTVEQLTSIYLSINTFSWWGVSSCFPCWLSGHFVTITLLLYSKQTAQLRWRRPIKWNARRWMLWLFLLPSLLAEHSVSNVPPNESRNIS